MFKARGLVHGRWKWFNWRSVSFSGASVFYLSERNGMCASSVVHCPSSRQSRTCWKAEGACPITSIFIRGVSRRYAATRTPVILRNFSPRLVSEFRTGAYYIQAFSMEKKQQEMQEMPAGVLALRFWERSRMEVYSALYHPFVVALAAGSLHMNAFQKYIAQDIYFLAAFAEAYGLAIENTDDQESKGVLEVLQRHVQLELDEVHLSDVTRSSGEKLMAEMQPNSATTAYTDFLLTVARGVSPTINGISEARLRKRKMAACTITAMTPCSRLYAFLGQQMKKSLDGGDTSWNAFSQWIETYASAEFGSTAVQSEAVLNSLAAPYSEDFSSLEEMERLYHQAMQLEVNFFAAQQPPYTNGPLLVPLYDLSKSRFVLVSDFDSTCSVSDSCPTLADLSVSTMERKFEAGKLSGSLSSGVALRGRWDSLVQQYAEDYTSVLDGLLSAEAVSVCQERSRGEVPGSSYHLRMAQEMMVQLSEFEVAANERVVEAGVLAGLDVGSVTRAGGRMVLRDGCGPLLTRIPQGNLHILSVCWSKAFVEGSFRSQDVQISNIQSNELQFDERGMSTGDISRRVQTPKDKESAFMDILKSLDSTERPFSVYIGDSLTDLLCLLRADIGIVVGRSSSLERVAEACGISFQSLYSGLLQQQRRLAREGGNAGGEDICWAKTDGVLYRISGWNELHAFLFGS